jgi:hypothetical protein
MGPMGPGTTLLGDGGILRTSERGEGCGGYAA